MKRLTYCLALVLLIAVTAGGWFLYRVPARSMTVQAGPDNLIRLHVLANSDSPEDQAVKLAVRDAIVEQLTPYLQHAQTVDEARKIMHDHRSELLSVANQVLQEQGFAYGARMEIGHFDFPIRSYGALVLPAGNYEAVRILLGSGQGKNWWCVLFPPLCFIDGTTNAVASTGLAQIETDQGSTPQVEFRWKVLELFKKQ